MYSFSVHRKRSWWRRLPNAKLRRIAQTRSGPSIGSLGWLTYLLALRNGVRLLRRVSSSPPLCLSLFIALFRAKSRVAASPCTSISRLEITSSRCSCVPPGAASSSFLLIPLRVRVYRMHRVFDNEKSKPLQSGNSRKITPMLGRARPASFANSAAICFANVHGLYLKGTRESNERKAASSDGFRKSSSPQIVIYRHRSVRRRRRRRKRRRDENKEQTALAIYMDPLILIVIQHFRSALLDRENDIAFGESATSGKAKIQHTAHSPRIYRARVSRIAKSTT